MRLPNNITLLLLIVLYLFVPNSYAIDYYVRASIGSDTYDGKTAAHPWETVAGGNSVNFTQDDRIKIYQTGTASWRTYDAVNNQSQTIATEIITRARYLLNDTSSSLYSDAEILAWINMGIQDVAARTQCIKTTAEITLVSGTVFYDIPIEYLAVKHAVYRFPTSTYYLLQENGDKLLQENGDGILITEATSFKGLIGGTIQEATGEEDGSEPAVWYVRKDQIGIFPVTGSDADGNIVTLYLIARPYEITSGANIPLPTIYDSALIQYVVHQAFIKDGRLASSKIVLDRYTKLLDRFRVDFDRPEGTE